VNTLEVVLLSLLAGISISLLIAIAGYLVWMLHSAKRGSTDMIASMDRVAADISLLRSQIESILNTHRQEMNAVVARINGDKLVEASNVIGRSAQRIETACVAFGQLATSMLSGDIVEPDLLRVRDSGLGPESYAPNPTGERWTGQSKTAAQDSTELSGEGGEDQPE
jgi:hypothetical protein